MQCRPDASKGSGKERNDYESEKRLRQYMSFHYGGSSVNCLYSEGPQNGFDFPSRCVELCIKHSKIPRCECDRALDVGCSVGRSTFDLAKSFKEVVGIDFSYGFIRKCEALKQDGRTEYEAVIEGDLTSKHVAIIPADVDRSRCTFRQGDACNLPKDIGLFKCVLAANLIDRLSHPKDFLARLSSLVVPEGICVIACPYSFNRKYTRVENWLGGYKDENGIGVKAFETMKRVLSDFELIAEDNLPYLIRETAREHMWSVSHVTVWKRK